MKVKVIKYGRWDESCNWQLESVKEKDMEEELFNSLDDVCGYTYSKTYNEYYAISEDKHRKMVITPVK